MGLHPNSAEFGRWREGGKKETILIVMTVPRRSSAHSGLLEHFYAFTDNQHLLSKTTPKHRARSKKWGQSRDVSKAHSQS